MINAERTIPAYQRVDCECHDRLVREIRPYGNVVLYGGFEVNTCLSCSTVTVSYAISEEPRPHDVRWIASRVITLAPDALAWVSEWPCLVGEPGYYSRPNVFYPANMKTLDLNLVKETESRLLIEQEALPFTDRLRHAGFPTDPPPSSLPKQLLPFAEVWKALNLSPSDPIASQMECFQWSWGTPFAFEILHKNAEFPGTVAKWIQDADPGRQRMARNAIDSKTFAHEEVREAIRAKLAAHSTPLPVILGLAGVLREIGAPAKQFSSLLYERAEQHASSYYDSKQLREIAEKIDRAHNPASD